MIETLDLSISVLADWTARAIWPPAAPTEFGGTMSTTLSFVLPKTYTDGSAIAAGDIVKVEVGSSPKGSTAKYSAIADVTADKADASGKVAIQLTELKLVPGDYLGAARVTTKSGQVSAWSNEAAFAIVDTRTPNPPTNFLPA